MQCSVLSTSRHRTKVTTISSCLSNRLNGLMRSRKYHFHANNPSTLFLADSARQQIIGSLQECFIATGQTCLFCNRARTEPDAMNWRLSLLPFCLYRPYQGVITRATGCQLSSEITKLICKLASNQSTILFVK